MDRRGFIAGALAGASATGLAGFAGKMAYGRLDPQSQARGRQSFSQQGEDIVLYHLLHGLLKLERPTYIDIGAADPVEANNTILLYWTGGHGVLVEPNPAYARKLRRYRPRDIVVDVGVGVTDAKEADYYVIRGRPTLNTFSLEEVARLRGSAREEVVEQVLKMPLISINRLISTYLGKAPDLLSIDVEGLDLAILRTLDFEKYRPGAIIAETILMGTPHVNNDISDFLTSKGYVARGGSLVNTIFADPGRYAKPAVS